MLRRLELHAFKAYEDEIVELEPLSILVGRNGSGKTSVLQAIEFFHGLVVQTLGDHLGRHGWEYKDLPRLKSENLEFGFAALIDLDEGLYWWNVRLGKRLRPGVAVETVIRVADNRYDDVVAGAPPDVDADTELMVRVGREMERLDESAGEWEKVKQTLTSSWLALLDPEEDAERYPGLIAVLDWASRIVPYVVLDPNRLREPSRLSADGIGVAGESLAGFLRFLRSRRPEAFQRVLDRVRGAYPQFQDVEIRAEGTSAFSIAVRESWTEGRHPLLNARQASDGLLRLFAFAALPELSPAPTLLMVDELENGVHPALLGALVSLLASLADEDGIQVVATSHSPIVLNYSDPESIILTFRGENGRAETVALDDTLGYQRLHATFGPGEMWVALGEDGLIRGPKKRGR